MKITWSTEKKRLSNNRLSIIVNPDIDVVRASSLDSPDLGKKFQSAVSLSPFNGYCLSDGKYHYITQKRNHNKTDRPLSGDLSSRSSRIYFRTFKLNRPSRVHSWLSADLEVSRGLRKRTALNAKIGRTQWSSVMTHHWTGFPEIGWHGRSNQFKVKLFDLSMTAKVLQSFVDQSTCSKWSI